MPHRGDRGAPRPDRFDTLETASRRARSEDAMPTVGRTHGVGFAELVESLSRASGMSEAATVPRPAEPGSPRPGAEHMGSRFADAASASAATHRPLTVGRGFMRAPRSVVPADTASFFETDPPRDEVVWTLAIAPEYYDKGDVDGTETPVILDPIRRWTKHPILKDNVFRPKDVRSAWEVFSSDGEPVGLVFRAEQEFVGVDMLGSPRPERTLAGAVWQIAVNG